MPTHSLTRAAAAPLPPPAPSLVEAGTSKITVSWSEPSHYGLPAQCYELQFRAVLRPGRAPRQGLMEEMAERGEAEEPVGGTGGDCDSDDGARPPTAGSQPWLCADRDIIGLRYTVHLTPAAAYEFRVRAFSEAGWGAFSQASGPLRTLRRI